MQFFLPLDLRQHRNDTVLQFFSLAVRNCDGFFVTLYKHHGDFLPPGIGNRRYPTVEMIPGIVLPQNTSFHIRKDVHIDIASYVF